MHSAQGAEGRGRGSGEGSRAPQVQAGAGVLWGRQLAARGRARGRRLLDELERAAKVPTGECVQLLHAAFDSLKERSAAVGLDSVLRGDAEDGEEIAGPGEAFTEELGRIGAITQEGYQGDGVLVEGFAAWCNTFLPSWEPLRRADGAEWKLAEVMSYELFESALARIAKRKAAGANRVTLDALVQAPEWVRRGVHEGLAEFATSGVFPPKWNLVIYVLLAKPRGDQRLVCKRRDIALLAQDLKLLCRMLKMESYDRMAGRIDPAQDGFCAGHSSVDPGQKAVLIAQMAKALGKPLYFLYIDLATFFPKCDRSVTYFAEVRHGLPQEVADLVALLFLEKEGKFDSAHGLGDEFKMHMGLLQGCVLSPSRAKLLLNTLVVAIRAHVRGFRLH